MAIKTTGNKNSNVIVQNISEPKPGESALGTGYSGSDSVSIENIPSVGIENIDVAIFDLFDKTLPFLEIDVIDKTSRKVSLKRPAVIFAGGERFAIAKSLSPVRDRNNALILPAIAIRRTVITHGSDETANRGISQETGEMVIKRKLSSSDRDYQNLINKAGLKNMQRNPLLPSTRRPTGSLKNDSAIKSGMLLDDKLGNNIWEIITMPSAKFYGITYEITLWAPYMESMNNMLEVLITSQLPQTNGYKIVTDDGYWFIAYVEDTFNNEDNLDEYTNEEKLIRYSFTLKVKAALFGANYAGSSVPMKKYYSITDFSFEIENGDKIIAKDYLKKQEITHDKFSLDDSRIDEEEKQTETINDNFLEEKRSGDGKYRFRRPIDRNTKKGETVYAVNSREELFNILFPPKEQ